MKIAGSRDGPHGHFFPTERFVYKDCSQTKVASGKVSAHIVSISSTGPSGYVSHFQRVPVQSHEITILLDIATLHPRDPDATSQQVT